MLPGNAQSVPTAAALPDPSPLSEAGAGRCSSANQLDAG